MLLPRFRRDLTRIFVPAAARRNGPDYPPFATVVSFPFGERIRMKNTCNHANLGYPPPGFPRIPAVIRMPHRPPARGNTIA
jgi:hypothetical protein